MIYSGALDDLDRLDRSELEGVFADEVNADHVRLYALASYMRHIPGGIGLAIDTIEEFAAKARDRERGAAPAAPGLG